MVSILFVGLAPPPIRHLLLQALPVVVLHEAAHIRTG